MEKWRDIEGFLGYQVSNQGRVRTFWKRKHYPTGYGSYNYLSDTPKIMSLSDDGDGYMKVMLYSHEDGRRYCRKVHRLVAEAFIPRNFDDDLVEYTVDHIQSGPDGKLDNSVENLRWLPRSENVRKAYRDGRHVERIRRSWKPIIAIDLWTGEECYFSSIQEASDMLGIDRTVISHILRGDHYRVKHYTFEYAGREDNMLYGDEDDQLLSWIRFGIR